MVRKLSIASSVAAIACAVLLPAGAATKTVDIPDRSFQPERISIFVGDTVRWVNSDNQRHTVSANSSSIALGESFDSSPGNQCRGGLLGGSGCLGPGETFSHRFTHEGTFTYRCKLHGSNTSFANCAMCGQVIVTAKATPPPTTSAPSKKPSVPSSPISSVSPSTTVSASPSGILTPPIAGGPSEDRPVPIPVIAGMALLLLGTSGFFVWRTMIRG